MKNHTLDTVTTFKFILTITHLIANPKNLADATQLGWPALAQIAEREKVAPMLLHAIAPDATYSTLPPEYQPLAQVVAENAARYLVHRTVLLQVNAVLAEAQIPALWLKGAALAHTVYPQPSLRPMSDLDVMVPLDRREQAVAVIEQLGFERHNLTGRDEPHHYVYHGGPNRQVSVELHWRFSPSILPDMDDLRWFWTQTQPLTFQNGAPHTALMLRPEAHLLFLCSHATLQHGEGQLVLRQYLDIHLLIEKTPIDWETLIDRAVHLKWTYAVERALTVTQEYFATALPDTVIATLRARRPPDEDTRIINQLRAPESRLVRVIRSFRQSSPTDRRRELRWLILPPRHYMRTRYHIPARVPAWPYYPYRWLDQMQGIIRGIWQLVRPRQQVPEED